MQSNSRLRARGRCPRISRSLLLSLPLVVATAAAADDAPHAHEHDHDEHGDDEVIVITASPLEHDREDLAASIDTLRRDEIVENLGSTIGETLSRRPGVATTGFAAGASRPVIRGQDAFRTGVVENGAGTADVSTLSPDHGVPVNPLAAERIEILRGPATLRYGGGSIAGVVNTITNRVPTRLTEGLASGEVLGAFGHNADEREIAALIDTSTGPIAWHFDAMSRDSNDYDIPDAGVQPGSFTDLTGFTGGTAYLSERYRLGFAYSRFENEYGIPEAEEEVTIDLAQNRYRIEGDLFEPIAGVREVRARVVVTDYEHDEIAGGAVGQTFENDEVEARLRAAARSGDGRRGCLRPASRRSRPDLRRRGGGAPGAGRAPHGGRLRVRGVFRRWMRSTCRWVFASRARASRARPSVRPRRAIETSCR